MNFKKRVITAAAAGSLLFFSITPAAFADTNITINGNLEKSDNTATVTTTNTSTVKQDNSATVNNNVNTNTNTGKNTASDNTGGNVTVHTGDSSSTTNVKTEANMNQATVPNCNCDSSTNVDVSGNGKKTDNNANVSTTNTQKVFQDNDANVHNNVNSKSNTGDNKANDNGAGNVDIHTGNASSDTTVKTAVNTNMVSPASGSTTGAGDVSAKIVGNLEKSDNNIYLDLTNSATVVQNNDARINNNVHSDTNSGYNSANDNIGGSVSIHTGDADSTTEVKNMANFNSADLDCGCLTGVTAKVAGNGKDTDNTIDADLTNSNDMFQDNDAYLNNKVDSDGNTGKNSAYDNGGALNDDPSITTQDATSTTTVKNEANQNMVGSDDSVVHLPGGSSVSVNFDLSALLHFLGLV